MSHGRHTAPRHAAPRPGSKSSATSTPGTGKAASPGGARKATTGGARKAEPGVRRTPSTPAGGRRIAGRPPVVHTTVTRFSAGQKASALVPLAVLSAAWTAGITGHLWSAGGDAAVGATAPSGSVTSVRTTGAADEASRSGDRTGLPTAALPSSSPGEQAPTSPGIGLPSESATPTTSPTSGPYFTPTSGPTVYPTLAPTSVTTTSPTSTPTSTATTTSTASPTSTTSTSSGVLTVAEATAQCLDQGISALDVVALDACVDNLLGL